MNQQELKQAVLTEKSRQGVLILAHTYQSPDVLEIADITGDSFALSKAAREVKEQRVLMCGVRFMAETVKIVSPEKEVILSHSGAGCPMAEQIDPREVEAYRQEHPDHAVCAYINTTAELKAVSDVCVTSSSAVDIVSRIPQKDVLFLPDKNLGSYVAKRVPEKNIHLMNGFCHVHNGIRPEHILKARQQHPGAKVAIHPECPADAVALADMAGSTKEIIDYALSCEDEIIFATERGVYDALSLRFPHRNFHQLEPQLMTCVNMKKTTLQGVYDALTGKSGEVILMDEPLRRAASVSIENMLRYGG
ncbi:MAG: quinolinate synthase NadA [Clostridiales bacterium]|jgi:quinolinate synthase|nr:quinolinate synthase NadA [Clostridiales bacterium]